VCVRGAFLCNQAVVPGIIVNGGGRIVHVASTTGTGPRPAVTATSVAKTALIRLTEGLALSAAASGVRCFAIHPGLVDTQLLRAYDLDFSQLTFESPQRAARLCLRLASGAYDALTGRFLRVDDDLDTLLGQVSDISERELLTLRIRPTSPSH
jgi:NAD(P)-dependent dehydrogenase (short-subunit alcohol dehydrogenase family)